MLSFQLCNNNHMQWCGGVPCCILYSEFRWPLKYCYSAFYFSETLVSAIREDIEEAKRQLDLPEHLRLKDNFFDLPEGKIVNHWAEPLFFSLLWISSWPSYVSYIIWYNLDLCCGSVWNQVNSLHRSSSGAVF